MRFEIAWMFDSFDPLVVCIPFIAGFIGWVTNWLAVKATLYPVHFVGIPPVFGWQGVMPRNAEDMALKFSTMIREQLLDMPALFAKIKADDEELNRMVDKLTDRVVEEFATNLAPDAWARAREKLRAYITNMIRDNSRDMMLEMMDRMAQEGADIIDIDHIMRDAMVEDRGLMGEILMHMVKPEFRFIEMSGLYFGFLFGIFQMLAWIVYPASWVLPVAGFLVGYITNFLALRLIFYPTEPMKIGPFVVQGLFIKRQKEVAGEFSDVVCDRVLKPANIREYLRREPARSKLKSILEEQLDNNMEDFENDPMVGMLVTPEKLREARADLDQRWDSDEDEMLDDFSGGSKHMRDQMHESLEHLDAARFNAILRPVFQKDEWKLMLLGGVLGVVIGALQVVFLFGESF